MSSDGEGFKIPSDVRDFADTNLGRARDVLGTLLGKARKGADTLQGMTQTAEIPAGVAFRRGLEFAEQNVAAAFEHAQKLVRAEDLQAAIKLQTDYAQTQSAALKAQAEELTHLVKPEKDEPA